MHLYMISVSKLYILRFWCLYAQTFICLLLTQPEKPNAVIDTVND